MNFLEHFSESSFEMVAFFSFAMKIKHLLCGEGLNKNSVYEILLKYFDTISKLS